MMSERSRKAACRKLDRLSTHFLTYVRYRKHHPPGYAVNPGPSEYFHRAALTRLSKLGLARAIGDRFFLEYVYATLAAWGLHRMGRTQTKLVGFPAFARTVRAQKRRVMALSKLRLSTVRTEERGRVVDCLCRILCQMKISASDARVVANTKVLHHLLPALVPPVDRKYSLWFFRGRTNYGKGHDEVVLRDVLPGVLEIASRNAAAIRKLVAARRCTSESKAVDDAITGFTLKHRP